MKGLVPLLVFGVVVIFLAIGLTLDPSRVPSPLIGMPMPTFAAESLTDAAVVVTEKDLTDRPLLVNVWATWCLGCMAEHELLMRIAHDHKIPIYGLNYRDERSTALDWLAQYGNPYRLMVYDLDAAVGLDWGVYGAPETFVVDGDGIIRHKHIGILYQDDFERDILPWFTPQKDGDA